MSTIARFAAAPIGPTLAARDGGLTLTALITGAPASTARSDIALSAGTYGAEFALWGDGSVRAIVGVCTSAAPLDAPLAANTAGIGWDLAAGTIRRGATLLKSGLAAVGKQQIVGVRVLRATSRVEFYVGATRVHEMALPLTGALHFAASIGSTEAAGDLVLAVNAGQWRAAGPAAAAGWRQAAEGAQALLADYDYLAAGSDPTPHARYEGLLVEGVTIVEALGWWPAGDQPASGTGAEATILDADGVLDGLVAADVVGAPVKIRRGTRSGTVAESAAVARFVVDGITVVDDVRRRLQLRDAHDDLDQPINRGTFLGNVPALAWRPMPVVIGAVASVPALGANSDGTVRFLADAAVHVGEVLDRGDPMEPGTWSMAPDRQQLLMQSPPLGPVVCDASSIGVVGGEPVPATLRQALTDVFGRIGKSAWSSADAAAIDAATGYAGIGYYAGDSVTARTALTAILNSYGAWYYRDADGTLRFVRTVAPEAQAATFEVSRADMATDLVRVTDRAPALTRRMAFRLNAQALGLSDLVTDFQDVPQARRDQLTALFRGQAYASAAMPARYAHADVGDPMLSLFWREADARAEIERVVTLYAVERSIYECTFRGTLDRAPLPGEIGRLTYPRYGLAAGRHVQVRRVSRVEGTGAITLTLWG